VKTENIQLNQEKSMPEQELPRESQESTETSTSQKEEDKVGLESKLAGSFHEI
jgi:hypothetical protein